MVPSFSTSEGAWISVFRTVLEVSSVLFGDSLSPPGCLVPLGSLRISSSTDSVPTRPLDFFFLSSVDLPWDDSDLGLSLLEECLFGRSDLLSDEACEGLTVLEGIGFSRFLFSLNEGGGMNVIIPGCFDMLRLCKMFVELGMMFS